MAENKAKEYKAIEELKGIHNTSVTGAFWAAV